MRFVAAPEYPVFPTRDRPLTAVRGGRAGDRGRRVAAIAELAPDLVVHDILTLAPALAAELEGLPVATLVPHVYPVTEPGFPPYAFGAQLPRTGVGRALWRAFEQAGRGRPASRPRRAQRHAAAARSRAR